MATRSESPARFSWGRFGFNMLQIFLPVALEALQARVSKEPQTLFVQSEDGVGNFNVATYQPVSLSEAMNQPTKKK